MSSENNNNNLLACTQQEEENEQTAASTATTTKNDSSSQEKSSSSSVPHDRLGPLEVYALGNKIIAYDIRAPPCSPVPSVTFQDHNTEIAAKVIKRHEQFLESETSKDLKLIQEKTKYCKILLQRATREEELKKQKQQEEELKKKATESDGTNPFANAAINNNANNTANTNNNWGNQTSWNSNLTSDNNDSNNSNSGGWNPTSNNNDNNNSGGGGWNLQQQQPQPSNYAGGLNPFAASSTSAQKSLNPFAASSSSSAQKSLNPFADVKLEKNKKQKEADKTEQDSKQKQQQQGIKTADWATKLREKSGDENDDKNNKNFEAFGKEVIEKQKEQEELLKQRQQIIESLRTHRPVETRLVHLAVSPNGRYIASLALYIQAVHPDSNLYEKNKQALLREIYAETKEEEEQEEKEQEKQQSLHVFGGAVDRLQDAKYYVETCGCSVFDMRKQIFSNDGKIPKDESEEEQRLRLFLEQTEENDPKSIGLGTRYAVNDNNGTSSSSSHQQQAPIETLHCLCLVIRDAHSHEHSKVLCRVEVPQFCKNAHYSRLMFGKIVFSHNSEMIAVSDGYSIGVYKISPEYSDDYDDHVEYFSSENNNDDNNNDDDDNNNNSDENNETSTSSHQQQQQQHHHQDNDHGDDAFCPCDPKFKHNLPSSSSHSSSNSFLKRIFFTAPYVSPPVNVQIGPDKRFTPDATTAHYNSFSARGGGVGGCSDSMLFPILFDLSFNTFAPVYSSSSSSQENDNSNNSSSSIGPKFLTASTSNGDMVFIDLSLPIAISSVRNWDGVELSRELLNNDCVTVVGWRNHFNTPWTYSDGSTVVPGGGGGQQQWNLNNQPNLNPFGGPNPSSATAQTTTATTTTTTDNNENKLHSEPKGFFYRTHDISCEGLEYIDENNLLFLGDDGGIQTSVYCFHRDRLALNPELYDKNYRQELERQKERAIQAKKQQDEWKKEWDKKQNVVETSSSSSSSTTTEQKQQEQKQEQESEQSSSSTEQQQQQRQESQEEESENKDSSDGTENPFFNSNPNIKQKAATASSAASSTVHTTPTPGFSFSASSTSSQNNNNNPFSSNNSSSSKNNNFTWNKNSSNTAGAATAFQPNSNNTTSSMVPTRTLCTHSTARALSDRAFKTDVKRFHGDASNETRVLLSLRDGSVVLVDMSNPNNQNTNQHQQPGENKKNNNDAKCFYVRPIISSTTAANQQYNMLFPVTTQARELRSLTRATAADISPDNTFVLVCCHKNGLRIFSVDDKNHKEITSAYSTFASVVPELAEKTKNNYNNNNNNNESAAATQSHSQNKHLLLSSQISSSSSSSSSGGKNKKPPHSLFVQLSNTSTQHIHQHHPGSIQASSSESSSNNQQQQQQKEEDNMMLHPIIAYFHPTREDTIIAGYEDGSVSLLRLNLWRWQCRGRKTAMIERLGESKIKNALSEWRISGKVQQFLPVNKPDEIVKTYQTLAPVSSVHFDQTEQHRGKAISFNYFSDSDSSSSCSSNRKNNNNNKQTVTLKQMGFTKQLIDDVEQVVLEREAEEIEKMANASLEKMTTAEFDALF